MLKTTFKSSVLGSTALALTLAGGFAGSANATPHGLFAGGATFPEKVYRDIMNCYGANSNGDTTVNLNATQGTCNAATGYRTQTELLYVGVGSGNGQIAFINHNAAYYNANNVTPDNPPVVGTTDLGVFYGTSAAGGTNTGTGTDWKAFSSTTASGQDPYDHVTFSGSDDPFNVAKYNSYHTFADNAGTNGWGEVIQLPGLIGAVSVPYGPEQSNWNPHGKKPTGATSGTSFVDLSTQTLCGIYTGVITDWSNAEITADNGNQTLGTGTIHPLYRDAGSGTTFLFTNGLVNQCASTSYPVPSSWQTAGGKNHTGIGDNSWFLNVKGAGLLPSNFVSVTGSGGMKKATNTNPSGINTVAFIAGSIGYVSTDFIAPFDPTGSNPAAIQIFSNTAARWAGNTTLAKKWIWPTPKTAAAIMTGFGAPATTTAGTSASPPCPMGPNTTPKLGAVHPTGGDAFDSVDGICAHNPLNWGATNPVPTSASAYPFGGFTFMDIYTCYADPNDVTALAGTTAGQLGYFTWYYGSTTATGNNGLVKASMAANGFSPVPGPWLSGAKKLISSDKKAKIGTVGQANTGCSGVTGTGA
jgi:ABC-type phosphate transport system substrate-binding protein